MDLTSFSGLFKRKCYNDDCIKFFLNKVHKESNKKYVHIKSIGFVVNSGKKMFSASQKMLLRS
jgi:hypothetical protein